ncbi:XRE family transcriptional regulator [Eubacterium maltosivorans]|uniref:XRE family transcriptional regulator n=1 Tax=Eubacterium maltosivorans TaxID=2041044 RepID=A0A4P9CA46_EUBML|nr:XRE family transcriptional regulator [Eubacterium maltosivorans]
MKLRYNNIEAERVRNELSKEQLAEKLNIALKTYYNWIDGKTPIPSTALKEMAFMFDKSIDYLLGIEKQEPKAS